MAEKEKGCWRFFDFRIATAGDVVVWEARAGENAQAVLDELRRLPETFAVTADDEALKRAFGDLGGVAFR